MKVKLLGQVLVELEDSWKCRGVITPTPYILNHNTIRVFCGFRDEEGISRIGYVDVDSDDPVKVKAQSKDPILDIGREGCFDDSGMIIGDVKKFGSSLYLFYVGFQLVKKAKFLAFSGVAISQDCGITFRRFKESPILDRAANGNMIRAIHSVNRIGDNVIAYYAVGNGWEMIEGRAYPQYEIYCANMDVDNFTFSQERKCVSLEGSEYRIGKPTVYRYGDEYIMFYTRGRSDDIQYYKPGVAFSKDGFSWRRNDEAYPIRASQGEWDSKNSAYPRVVTTRDGRQFLFYSGNSMGEGGFGVVELTSDLIETEVCL